MESPGIGYWVSLFAMQAIVVAILLYAETRD